jgi:hypothetical protein
MNDKKATHTTERYGIKSKNKAKSKREEKKHKQGTV